MAHQLSEDMRACIRLWLDCYATCVEYKRHRMAA